MAKEVLPIDSAVGEIVEKARAARAVVVVAEPGAGKTTRVPVGILRGGLLTAENPNVVMLQPRRVAARAAAQRIADENNWEIGGEVGYQIRFEKRISGQTRLRIMTEGILTRQILEDPFLSGVGAVILDEFHERSLHTDVAAALLREIQTSAREDLILIVMSATLEAGPVAEFLGGCPIINVAGRMYPVEVEHWPGTSGDGLAERAIDAVINIVRQSDGDILVFLPGVQEIHAVMRGIEGLAGQENLAVLPLHGSLSGREQSAALEPGKKRKVICATNIAETSLTIDGVKTVIDGGMARVATYDARRGLDRLELKRISRASANQRAGRAGRTGPGRCIRLWSAREHSQMEEFEKPEVLRVDLAGTVLAIHGWGAEARTFGWYERPPEERIESAESLLEMLGALTSERNGKITEMGKKMLPLPVHPRVARLMVEGAGHGLLDQAAAVAAVLSEKDFLISDGQATRLKGCSDVLRRLELLEKGGVRQDGMDISGVEQVGRIREQLLRIGQQLPGLRKPKQQLDIAEETLLKLVLAAYPDRVCRRRKSDPSQAAMVGGGGVRIGRESIVQQAEFFVAVDARHDDRLKETLVRIASAIEPQWLDELFPQEIVRRQSAMFDQQSQRVIGISSTLYRDLVLREDRDAAVDRATAGQVLGEALREKMQEIIAADEKAAELLARVRLLWEQMPEKQWPKWDELELGEILAEACEGKRSAEEVMGGALAEAMKARLAWPMDRLVEEHAPTEMEVPSGSRIKLEYAGGQGPVMKVRLQEVFGWTATPRVAGGRVAVVMHLLGPNYRPVQVTSDLGSFWRTTYFQVRKDLRVRYPKHSWPEDPLTATPQAKGRRRN